MRELGIAMQRDLGDAWASGKLRCPVHTVFPFERAADALALMEANGHFGKIVLEGVSEDG